MFRLLLLANRILMDKAGEGGSGGGSGSGTGGGTGGDSGAGAGGQGAASAGAGQGTGGILFGDDGSAGGGQGGQGTSGGAGDGGAQGGQGGDSGNGGGQGASAIQIPSNWKESLPEGLKDHAALGNLNTVEAVVKSLIHAQSMVGADKIVVPKTGTPLAEMRPIFERLGLAKTEEEYKFDVAQGTPVDKDFLGAFTKSAYSLGILPEQAKGLVEWFAKVNTEAYNAQVSAYNASVNVELGKLKGEWGDAWNENIARAKAGLRDLPKAEQDFIRERGLGDNPHMIRMLAKFGSTLDESRIKGEGGTGNSIPTPAEAKAEIAKIKSDIKGPYFDKNHAQHLETKQKVEQLYKYAHPENKTQRAIETT